MSWDLSIMDLPAGAVSVEDIPDDFQPRSLGPRSELIRKIQAVAPDVDFSDPTWGQIVRPDFVIELNLGPEPIVDSIMLHVRGGDEAVGLIADLLTTLGHRALDLGSGTFFTESVAGDTLATWRGYRDRVTRDT